ncbi:MAG: cephalosporin hydroxylase family protein [Candidatus Dormibacteraeota bacterium]|nr:cephalosporin hydroxylase family protein [Candidatus Dormibacteraeota bacterium]
MAADQELRRKALDLFTEANRYRYSYNFTWLGRPIIQYPQDIVAAQEIVWRVKPNLIVETGIAHGGSLIFWASMLQLLGEDGHVVGIDIDIRKENRVEIERHPLAPRITLLEGSSVDPQLVDEVRALAAGRRTMVVLDSNHSHAHVRKELEAYAPLVRSGSYLIVFDTVIEDLPADCFPDRPWGPGDNPKTALADFLRHTDRFEVDAEIDAKLLLSVAPGGYLRCTKDPS